MRAVNDKVLGWPASRDGGRAVTGWSEKQGRGVEKIRLRTDAASGGYARHPSGRQAGNVANPQSVPIGRRGGCPAFLITPAAKASGQNSSIPALGHGHSSLLDFGRRAAAARFSGGGSSGLPARVTGDRSRRAVRTWPGGGGDHRRADFTNPYAPLPRQAAGAARPVPPLPIARHRTLIGGAA